jgi:hypothetical protein
VADSLAGLQPQSILSSSERLRPARVVASAATSLPPLWRGQARFEAFRSRRATL